MSTEFPQPGATPYPLGLRGVEHRPGNVNFRALVSPPPRLAEPRTQPWHRTTASLFDQQGSSCVAQATIGMLITLPHRYSFQPDRAGYDSEAERHRLYLDAQDVDPWAGGEPDYEGTSTEAAMIVLRSRGIVTGWNWLYGEAELWEWVSFYGPALVGSVWTDGMFFPDNEGFIHPTGFDVGGHAYEIAFASQPRQAYRIINSWSAEWGQLGRAWISRGDMRSLLAQDGEAISVLP